MVTTLHQPVRMCVSCRNRKLKSELDRYIVKQGILTEDKTKSNSSRGIYICTKQCLENYTKRGLKLKKGKQ